jgi:anti-sigma B factor antagonist
VLRIEVEQLHEGIVVLGVTGEVDRLTVGGFDTALHRELEHDPAMLVLDLSGVSFLAVAGLRALNCAATRAVGASVLLVVVHDDSRVIKAALRRVDLVSVVPAFRTLGQAVAVWTALVDTLRSDHVRAPASEAACRSRARSSVSGRRSRRLPPIGEQRHPSIAVRPRSHGSRPPRC